MSSRSKCSRTRLKSSARHQSDEPRAVWGRWQRLTPREGQHKFGGRHAQLLVALDARLHDRQRVIREKARVARPAGPLLLAVLWVGIRVV